MKIISVKTLIIPDIKVIKYARFCDNRGYFSEHFRKSDINNNSDLKDMQNIQFVQGNQSFSKKNVIRGMHFQWNPYMGKLVRTVKGHMIDLIMDIRKGSENYGKIIAYDMPSNDDKDFDEWIWVPPGFAHGNMFLEDTIIEYLCTGEYSPGCEAGISPLSKDIDFSLMEKELKEKFNNILKDAIISDKDRNGINITQWTQDKRSENFIYNKGLK